MSTARKKSKRTESLLAAIDRYEIETGDKSGDLKSVARWAHRKGILTPRDRDPVKAIAHELRSACARDYITDEKGQPVRHRLAYIEQRGDKQMAFWFKMEDATPEKMRLNAAMRRNGTLQDVLQLHRDIRYFNNHHNPGDPIQLDLNFQRDVEEHDLPPDYNPDDDGDGDGQPV
ncbi:MAG: hypothetical protein ACTHN5_12650 [Phycisphaerae bacterium]